MASSEGLDNDTRGWILSAISGVACVLGASIICVDIIIRQFPGKRDFRIQDSNVFLACSLSLSFGVMLFSALYSMLPSSKEYLKRAGFSDSKAGLILMSSFVVGFIGIQVVSRVLHQFMPSHVVDCDHTHEEQALEAGSRNSCSHGSRQVSRSRSIKRQESLKQQSSTVAVRNGHSHDHTPLSPSQLPDDENNEHHGHEHTEHTPLLAGVDRLSSTNANGTNTNGGTHKLPGPTHLAPARTWSNAATAASPYDDRRPSMLQVQKRVLSFVKDTKTNCDESGSCYGYTDPCGQECFKHLGSRSSTSLAVGPRPHGNLNFLSTTTGPFYDDEVGGYRTSRVHSRDVPPDYIAQHDASCSSVSGDAGPSESGDEEDAAAVPLHRSHSHHSHHSHTHSLGPADSQHHHHVPTNAFMAIGLQTSIAIALHKFPEGFITYATNHANPALGFAVFMALFVHNISEGFAMALPLYMALGSRVKAMVWAAILGGLSQPLGAAAAALWFKLARGADMAPGATFYAVLFAVTAGIMVSVALQLFVEALSLNHNRNLCILFGFLGMALLGFSGALVGHDH